MERRLQLFNAFTGISFAEKSNLLHFLLQTAKDLSPLAVQESVDYALKIKPSFGGFIVGILERDQFIAAAVVNKTGLEGIRADYLLVLAEVANAQRYEEKIWRELINRVIDYADGDIAFSLPTQHLALNHARKMGFQEQYVELRFQARSQGVTVRV